MERAEERVPADDEARRACDAAMTELLSAPRARGDRLAVRSSAARKVHGMLRHYRELAELPREARVDNVSDLPDQDLYAFPAEPPKSQRESYTCKRCSGSFKWLMGLMPWLCSKAESCPLCVPLCASCRAQDLRKLDSCKGSGLPTEPGRRVTCMCGAKFENITKIPSHRPLSAAAGTK